MSSQQEGSSSFQSGSAPRQTWYAVQPQNQGGSRRLLGSAASQRNLTASIQSQFTVPNSVPPQPDYIQPPPEPAMPAIHSSQTVTSLGTPSILFPQQQRSEIEYNQLSIQANTLSNLQPMPSPTTPTESSVVQQSFAHEAQSPRDSVHDASLSQKIHRPSYSAALFNSEALQLPGFVVFGSTTQSQSITPQKSAPAISNANNTAVNDTPATQTSSADIHPTPKTPSQPAIARKNAFVPGVASGSNISSTELPTLPKRPVGVSLLATQSPVVDILNAQQSILESLDSTDRRRVQILCEIYETEKKYRDYLNGLCEMVITPCREKSILTESQISEIFDGIEALLQLHDQLLRDISKRLCMWEPNTKIGDIFLKYSKSFSLYNVYGNSFEKSDKLLKKCLKKNSQFSQLQRHVMDTSLFKKLDFASVLIMPIQRLPRYILLLEDLLKHTERTHPDYLDIQSAINEIRQAAREIKTKSDEIEIIKRAYAMDKLITLPKNKPLIRPSRRLIDERELVLAGPSGAVTYTVVIFNDILLVTTKEKSGRYNYIGRIKIKDLKVRALAQQDALMLLKRFKLPGAPSEFARFQHFLQLTTPHATFIACMSSEGDLRMWLNTIDSLKADQRSSCWSFVQPIGDSPTPCFNHTVTQVGDLALQLGGQYKDWVLQPSWSEQVWCYSLLTNSWEAYKSSKVAPCSEHSATIVNGVVYIFGGQNRGQFNNTLYALQMPDPNDSNPMIHWEVINAANAPCARASHLAVATGNRFLYIFGGYYRTDTFDSTCLNDLYCFDTATRTWRAIEPRSSLKPSPRYGHVGFAYRERIYVFGGRSAGDEFSDLYYFDTVEETWTQVLNSIGYIPTPRIAIACASMDQHLILLGGENRTTVFSDVFHYNAETNEWHLVSLTVSLDNRMGASLIVQPDPAAPNLLSSADFYCFGGRVMNLDGSKIPTSDIIQLRVLDTRVRAIPTTMDTTTLWQWLLNTKASEKQRADSALLMHNISSAREEVSYTFNLPCTAVAVPEFEWTGQPHEVKLSSEKLRDGIYGSVYRGHLTANPSIKVLVEIINISPTATDGILQLLREMKRLVKCRHPTLLRYYGAAVVDKALWIMYEDVGDFTLKEIINEAPLGERAIATAALCTIHGLTYLHSNNIVAGNIRAATLFVNSIGVSLLGYYGLSPYIDNIVATSGSDTTYAAPEQLQNPTAIGNVTKKTDIWALGITLVELAENEPPHRKLQKPKKFPDAFISFLEQQCLVESPLKRATAISLISHPFLLLADSNSLREAITREKKPRRVNSSANIAFMEELSSAVRELLRTYREDIKQSIPMSQASVDMFDTKSAVFEANLLNLLEERLKLKNA